jgi:ADP-ribose pyrophosphatase YjhB (NUDIX family)
MLPARGGGMDRQFGAGGVVVRKKEGKVEVLLIKDAYGRWTWPKGHMEGLEKPRDTARREISEETGLKQVKLLDEIGKQEYHFTFGRTKIFKTVFIFLAEASSDERLNIQTEEIRDAAWFSAEKALETIEYKGSRDLLKKGIELYAARAQK